MPEDNVATFGSEGLNRVTEPQPAPEVNQEERRTAHLEPGGPIQTPPAPEVHYGLRQNLPAGPAIQEADSPGVDYSEMDANAENPAEDTAERAHRVVHAHGGDVVPPDYPKESRGLYDGDLPHTAKAGPEPDGVDDDELAQRRAAAETAKQSPEYPKEARGIADEQGEIVLTEKAGSEPAAQRERPQRAGPPRVRRFTEDK